MRVVKVSDHKSSAGTYWNIPNHLREWLDEKNFNWTKAFTFRSEYMGIVVEESKDQWTFLPVGLEVWYDEESRTFATVHPSRLIESQPTLDLSKLRENVGVQLCEGSNSKKTLSSSS